VVCEAFLEADTFVHRLDPRVRVVAALALAVLVAVSGRLVVPGAALALAIGLAVAARLPAGATLKRLAGLNVFVLVLAAVLPLSVPGPAAFAVGPLAFSGAGLLQAAAIALKANAILLAVTALLSTMELSDLGHALHHLRLPDKLVHLLLFSVRYIEVLRHEYGRLLRAMRVRGFRPRTNRHTYRTIGYLVGMLLVRSVDRSERILAAMKCRGFKGRFYLLDHFRIRPSDTAFAAAAGLVLLALGWVEWGPGGWV